MSYEEFAARYSEDIANLADKRWPPDLRARMMTPRERFENPTAYYCAIILDYHDPHNRWPRPLTVAELNSTHTAYRCLARFGKPAELVLGFNATGDITYVGPRAHAWLGGVSGPMPYWKYDLDGNLCRTVHSNSQRWGEPELPIPANGIFCCPPGIKTYLDPESPEGRAELALPSIMDPRPVRAIPP